MSGAHNFKEETGDMQFDASGFLKVNVAAGGAGDGAVLDGVSSSIKASVLDLTASNPQAVAIVDGNGDQISSFGGGTQYTEDAAAAANPVGTALNLIRQDTPASEVSANGDNIAQRGTAYGAAYTQIVSSAGAFIDSFGGGTQYTEDAAAAANPVGTAPILIRTDTPATQVSADGDNIAQRGTNYGAAYVQVVSSAGAYIDTFGGGTQYTEDAAAAANPVGTAPILIRQDTPASEVSANGDNIAQRATAYGAAYTQIVSSAGAFIDTFGGGTQYTEDAAAAADPVGTMGMAVRADALAAVTSADGDNIAFRATNKGELYVKQTDVVPVSDNGGSLTVDGSVAVTNAGTFAVQVDGAALASLQLLDDAVYGSDAALSKTLGIGAVFDDVATVAITENQAGYLRMSSRRALLVEGVSGGTAIPVSLSTVPVTNAGTFVVQENGAALTSLQLIDDSVVTLGTTTYTEATSKALSIGAVRRDADTTLVDTTNEWGPLQMDARGFVKVEVFSGETLPVSLTSTTITGSVAVTNAGTFVVQENGAALTSLQLIDDTVFTDDTSTHSTGATKGLGIMAVANPTDAAVDANDIGMVAMTLARALKNDITTIAGTAPTTVGKLDVKGADGDVFVRQATASNLNMTEASAASALTSLQLIDDTVYTDDTSTHATGTSKGLLFMAAATPTDAAVNANDIGALAMTVNRELLVQVNTALPAGTNAIGKLAANSGVDIGDVDVTTVGTITPGTAATSLGKAIDSAGGATDTGVASLVIRDDALTTLTPVDGDYVAERVNARGAKWVAIEDGAGGQITSFGGGTEVAEDTAHSSGVLGGVPLWVRRDTPTALAGTDNDYIPGSTDANGGLWVSLATKLDATNDAVAVGVTTTGGATTFMASGSDGSSILVATKQTIKASAGQLYGYYIYNPEAAVSFVHFYNTDTVTVGTTNPQMTIPVPAGSAANLTIPFGVSFSTAISCAATTTAGGNTAPATGVSLVAWYK